MLTRRAIQAVFSCSGPFVGKCLRPHVVDARQRPFDYSHHVRELDLGGRPRKRISALGSALALDDPGVLQLSHDGLEELDRYRLSFGNLIAFDRRLLRCRQLEHRAHGVVRFR